MESTHQTVARVQFPAVVRAAQKTDAALEGMADGDPGVESKLTTLQDQLAQAFAFYQGIAPQALDADGIEDSAKAQTEIAHAYGFEQHAVGVFDEQDFVFED